MGKRKKARRIKEALIKAVADKFPHVRVVDATKDLADLIATGPGKRSKRYKNDAIDCPHCAVLDAVRANWDMHVAKGDMLDTRNYLDALGRGFGEATGVVVRQFVKNGSIQKLNPKSGPIVEVTALEAVLVSVLEHAGAAEPEGPMEQAALLLAKRLGMEISEKGQALAAMAEAGTSPKN